MVDYSIAAIPTEYRGRTYRSRLEARWAAFFDRLGLAHEYEPFDLGAWSPDFLLTDIDTLVEVKPLTEFDADVWAKMVAACKERGLLSGEKPMSLLLTRVAPDFHKGDVVQLGWVAMPWYEEGIVPKRALLGWVPDNDQPRFWPEIVAIVTHPIGWITSTDVGRICSKDISLDDLEHFAWPESYGDYTMGLWARATSDVQWSPDEKA
jgi:hypothetical protein